MRQIILIVKVHRMNRQQTFVLPHLKTHYVMPECGLFHKTDVESHLYHFYVYYHFVALTLEFSLIILIAIIRV